MPTHNNSVAYLECFYIDQIVFGRVTSRTGQNEKHSNFTEKKILLTN